MTKTEYGSFRLYLNLKDKFYFFLTKAIMYADNKNKNKLKKIFPQICIANETLSWNLAPDTDLPKIHNKRLDENKVKEILFDKAFLWYLNESGHFMTNLSHAFIYADSNNKKLIEKQFPNLVKAFNYPY